MKRPVTILFAAALLGLVTIGAALATVNRFLDTPLNIKGDAVVYEIRSGMPFARVSRELAELGVVGRPDWFRWYARLNGQAQNVRAGEYHIEAGTTPRTLLDKFVAGDVRLYSFTIVEGWSFRELLNALAQSEVLQKTLDSEALPAFLETLGTDATHPEGLFLPETYHFPKNSTDADVLRRAYALMQETLQSEWKNRETDLPFDEAYDALILASIIEKETAKESERAQISGVFVRRLNSRMRLQTDPTVIYGIGDAFDGNLTRAHLTTDTPYNTYTRHGLPPTPIAMPGRAAIVAALHPQEGTSLYFVATGLGDGGHEFSDTKSEHDAAVRRYVRRQRAARASEINGK